MHDYVLEGQTLVVLKDPMNCYNIQHLLFNILPAKTKRKQEVKNN